MSDPIVGIDLGTSNTVVAHVDATGVAQVLADANGYKIHPSVVSFHPTGGVVVGAAAKQRKVIDPKNTIYSVKRLIGRAFSSPEVQTARLRSPFEIKEGANQLPLIVTRGGEFAVPEISAIVLDHARNVATSALQTEVSRAVVTVPASFNDAQRSATATAGSIAGLTVVRVLNEPTAAALAYGNARGLHETIAVYDFGGGTFDITILKLGDQIYEVLGTAGNTFLGGDDLDERIVDRMVEKFLAENRVDLRTNEVSMMRLRAVAEQTKIELSRRTRAVVKVDEIAYGPNGKPLDLQIEIRREEFVDQVAEIIDRTFPVCQEALSYAGLGLDQIDDVILVGGTTKIPYVRDQVAKFFAKAPRTDVNPEDAVAVGAALQAAALDRVLQRKNPAMAPVPAQAFDDAEGTFDGATETQTFTRDAETPLEQAGDFPVEKTEVSAAKRTTAGYGATPAPALKRPTERAAMRGEHKDVFEERTPPPLPQQPVIGRLTKNLAPNTAKGAAAQPPLPKTTQRAPAQRPPAAPVAGPQAKTLMIAPDPGSTAPGMGPAMDEDIGFPNIETEKGFVDLDSLVSPAATARGFAPPLAMTAPTLVVEPPQASAPPAPQAYPVMSAKPSPVVMDVTPRGLGIATVAGFAEELIRRNSRVPSEIRKMFTTSRDDQDAVRIIVCQGESRRLDKNVVIGELRLEQLPRRPRGETTIEVTFMLDANGILHVRARDAQTGKEQRATLDLVGGISKEDVSASRERLQALRR